MLKRFILIMLVALVVCGCNTSADISGKILSENLSIILANSGIAGVILLFWFLDRVQTNRLIGRLNDTVTRALNNNTAAMSALAATLQTGCPAVRAQAGESQGGAGGVQKTGHERGGGGDGQERRGE